MTRNIKGIYHYSLPLNADSKMTLPNSYRILRAACVWYGERVPILSCGQLLDVRAHTVNRPCQVVIPEVFSSCLLDILAYSCSLGQTSRPHLQSADGYCIFHRPTQIMQ